MNSDSAKVFMWLIGTLGCMFLPIILRGVVQDKIRWGIVAVWAALWLLVPLGSIWVKGVLG